MNQATIETINKHIEEGIRKKEKENPIGATFVFLEAWKLIMEHTPANHSDFLTVVETYNGGGESYDWHAWIWEVCEVLEQAGDIHKDCLKDRLHFIDSFKKRFPATTDEDVLECLQRHLIKTNFLLEKEEVGKQAVHDFNKQFPNSVGGYMDWADTLIKRATPPTGTAYKAALTIYEKGLAVDDDADFMDILKERIEETKDALSKLNVA